MLTRSEPPKLTFLGKGAWQIKTYWLVTLAGRCAQLCYLFNLDGIDSTLPKRPNEIESCKYRGPVSNE